MHMHVQFMFRSAHPFACAINFPLVAAEVPKRNPTEIFRISYDQLSETLATDDITGQLFSKELISRSVKEETQVTGQTIKHKTVILLSAVEREINAEPNNFNTF